MYERFNVFDFNQVFKDFNFDFENCLLKIFLIDQRHDTVNINTKLILKIDKTFKKS